MENVFPTSFALAIDSFWPQVGFGAVLAGLLDPSPVIDLELAGGTQKLLNDIELHTARQFRLVKRRQEFLTARLCAKLAIAEFGKCCGIDLTRDFLTNTLINSREDRRPFINGPIFSPSHNVDLSITHSHDFAAALVAERSCGIDLQQMRPTLFKVRERFCFAAEEKMLAAGCESMDPLARLVMLWSAKEAVQKAFSANHAMPGMLEMTLAMVHCPAPDVYAMRFAINTRNYTKECHVLTTMFAGNGLAVCLLPQGEPHAGTA